MKDQRYRPPVYPYGAESPRAREAGAGHAELGQQTDPRNFFLEIFFLGDSAGARAFAANDGIDHAAAAAPVPLLLLLMMVMMLLLLRPPAARFSHGVMENRRH